MDYGTPPPPLCIKFCTVLLLSPPLHSKAKLACPKGKIILVKFMRWHLWRVYISTCSPLWHILVMQFLEARAPVFLPCTCSRHILQSAKQLPNPKQLSLPIFSAKRTCNLGKALVSRQWQRPCGCPLISGGRYRTQVIGQITSAS